MPSSGAKGWLSVPSIDRKVTVYLGHRTDRSVKAEDQGQRDYSARLTVDVDEGLGAAVRTGRQDSGQWR